MKKYNWPGNIRELKHFVEKLLVLQKGERITFDEILQNLNERDNHDTNRKINPLLKAEDAVLIDNSVLSIQEQNNLIFNLINTKNNESSY